MRFPPVNNEDPLGSELLLSRKIRRSLQRSSQANERWSCRQGAVTASFNSHGGWWGELTFTESSGVLFYVKIIDTNHAP